MSARQVAAVKRVAVYVRISQDRRGEEAGVRRQREDCLALAEAVPGWSVVEVYEDNDVSATKSKPRPAYQRLLADVEAGQVDAIVAWMPDRLYRKLTDLEGLIERVEKHKVAIRTVRAGDLDLSTATGRMTARIIGAVATAEGEVKAERQMRAIIQKRQEGRPPGGRRMFGYASDGMTLVPEEVEAAREVAAAILAGATLTGQCRWLNDRGLLTTQGNAWAPTQLRHYLINPRLAGHSVHKGQVVGRGQWVPIFDEETHLLLTSHLGHKTRTGRVPRVALLPGLLLCGRCGTPMQTTGRRKRNGEWQRRYRCPGPKNAPGASGCGAVSGDAEPLEEFVQGWAETAINRPEVRQRLAELRAAGGGTGVLREVEALRDRRAELEHLLTQPGAGSVGSLVAAITDVSARLEVLEKSLAQSSVDRVPLPEVDAEWPANLNRRRALLEKVVARVHLDPAPDGWSPKGRHGFDTDRVRIDPVPEVEGAAEVA